jgi:hypothetical protein
VRMVSCSTMLSKVGEVIGFACCESSRELLQGT